MTKNGVKISKTVGKNWDKKWGLRKIGFAGRMKSFFQKPAVKMIPGIIRD